MEAVPGHGHQGIRLDANAKIAAAILLSPPDIGYGRERIVRLDQEPLVRGAAVFPIKLRNADETAVIELVQCDHACREIGDDPGMLAARTKLHGVEAGSVLLWLERRQIDIALPLRAQRQLETALAGKDGERGRLGRWPDRRPV